MKIFLYSLFMFTFFSATIAQTTNNNYICKKAEKELWRELADSGSYNDAITILLDSIPTSKQKDKHRNYWHLGQLYACNNEYAIAIEYLKKSTGFFDKIIDREYRLYYNGTIAFLKKDKQKQKICNDKLWNKHSDYYYSNACRLKALYDNFEKPYKVAYDMSCK
jgi:hypothetical protein